MANIAPTTVSATDSNFGVSELDARDGQPGVSFDPAWINRSFSATNWLEDARNGDVLANIDAVAESFVANFSQHLIPDDEGFFLSLYALKVLQAGLVKSQLEELQIAFQLDDAQTAALAPDLRAKIDDAINCEFGKLVHGKLKGALALDYTLLKSDAGTKTQFYRDLPLVILRHELGGFIGDHANGDVIAAGEALYTADSDVVVYDGEHPTIPALYGIDTDFLTNAAQGAADFFEDEGLYLVGGIVTGAFVVALFPVSAAYLAAAGVVLATVAVLEAAENTGDSYAMAQGDDFGERLLGQRGVGTHATGGAVALASGVLGARGLSAPKAEPAIASRGPVLTTLADGTEVLAPAPGASVKPAAKFNHPVASENFSASTPEPYVVNWLNPEVDVLPTDTQIYKPTPVDPDAGRGLGAFVSPLPASSGVRKFDGNDDEMSLAPLSAADQTTLASWRAKPSAARIDFSQYPQGDYVLIVDDEMLVSELYKMGADAALEESGVVSEVVAVGSDEEILAVLRERGRPRLAIVDLSFHSDINGPNYVSYNGLELFVEALAPRSGVPLVISTGHNFDMVTVGDPGDRRAMDRAMSDGRMGFVQKPSRLQRIVDLVSAIFVGNGRLPPPDPSDEF